MSLDLCDLRAKVTRETHCALVAIAQATCRDQSEIVREVMHAWALQQINAASALQRLLVAEGLARDTRGSIR